MIDIAHLSDTHLGYEAFPAVAPGGRNQRGVDIVRAFANVIDDIVAWDPALVLHTGDVSERPTVPISYMLAAKQRFEKAAGMRPDGTRRQVVIIAGNHEAPRSHREICWLHLLDGIPGVHVVTNRYATITFDPERDGCDPALADVAVHALPHDMLKSVDLDTVVPTPGKRNILMAHGVATGSDLFLRALGREYPIPADLLARDWDYGALGHWHKRGPVGIAGDANPDSHIWYAGSPENVSFRDLRDETAGRGYLRVQLGAGRAKVSTVDLPIRRMFRLPVIDAAGMSPDDIRDALLARIAEADLDGAVVSQTVTGMSRDTWALVDVTAVRGAAGAALHYEINARYATATIDAETGERTTPLGDLADVLAERAEVLERDGTIPAGLRDAVSELARTLLADALDTAPGDAAESADKADTDTAPEADDQAA